MILYLDDEDYELDTVFTQTQLGQQSAHLVLNWFNFETYNIPEPPEGHNLNPEIQSNTIKYWKKVLFLFVPNLLIAWNELSGQGNPTRSKKLNDLIKKVKKKEGHGQGAPTQACHSINLEGGWNYHYLQILCTGYDELSISFDWEIDCTTQAKCQNIKRHNHFDFVLKAKLDWSKNILEEQDAPWQAVLASNDHIYCVHLSLALWLESMQQNLPWLH